LIKTMQIFCILGCLAATLACGSREVAGSLKDHEASETGTTQSPGWSGSTNSSGDSTETMGVGSGSTGVGTTDSGTTVQGSETTDTSTGSMENSTGEPMAACGNGVLEVFGLAPEECDDGNLDPDDGCSDTCALDRRVFVTSALYNGADIESLNVANALCANRADDQGWPDALDYRA
jgi:cysteine-rich repeat protein